MKSGPLAPAVLEGLQQLDSCTVANAIEVFDVRLANTGFTDSTVRCLFEEFPPLVGYAATLRIRTSDPPMEGHSYRYQLDWLDHLISIPEPRVLVIEDLDRHPGLGSFVGEVHANILRAIHCAGLVTNGAVRDVPAVRALKFPLFARNVSVSHAYAHVVDWGKTVEVGGMAVAPGDLVHGDLHGVQTVPLQIAPKVPAVAERIAAEDREIVLLSTAPDFSMEKLRSAVAALREKRSRLAS